MTERGALLNVTGGGSFEESEHGFVAANLQVCPITIATPLVRNPFRIALFVVLALAKIPFYGLFLRHAPFFLVVPMGAVFAFIASFLCLFSFPPGAGGPWSALSLQAFKVLHGMLIPESHFLKSFLHDCLINAFISVTYAIKEFFERGQWNLLYKDCSEAIFIFDSLKLFEVEVDADLGVGGKDVTERGALLNVTGGGSFEESEHGFVAANLQVFPEVQKVVVVVVVALTIAPEIVLVLNPFRSALIVVLASGTPVFYGLFLRHAPSFLVVPIGAVFAFIAIFLCLFSFPHGAGGL